MKLGYRCACLSTIVWLLQSQTILSRGDILVEEAAIARSIRRSDYYNPDAAAAVPPFASW